MDGVEVALAGALTPRAAAEAVLVRLGDDLGLMPSVYLALGDRLRLMGARGYWQAFDGMSGSAGVIGQTWQTGVEHVLPDVGEHPSYLAAASSVLAEICLPLCVGKAVVGVLNVEALRGFSGEELGEIRRCADLLRRRLAELPQARESKAEWLSRQIVGLVGQAAAHDQGAVQHKLVQLAAELADLDTALLVRSLDGEFTAVAGVGSLAEGLERLTSAEFAEVAQWVSHGATVYSLGVRDGVGFPGNQPIRAAGAQTVVAVPLALAGAETGLLLLADADLRLCDTYVVALLELLAAQASCCLQVCAAMSGLRDRAERDGLTSLGHQGAFKQALPVQRSVRDRGTLAVMYLDIDHFKAVNDSLGHAAGDALLVGIATALRHELRGSDQVFRIGGDEFAALAHVQNADAAVALAHRLADCTRRATGASLSVGVALAQDLESDHAVLARADAALYLVKQRGRGDVELLTF